MDKNELDATVLASRLGVDSKVLGESILLTGKRRDALLNSLITPKQQLPSDVAELMGHREWRTAMTTMALGMLVAQDQEPALTATLLAPWRIPGAPVAPPQAPAAPKQAAPAMTAPPPTAVPITPPAAAPAAPTPTTPQAAPKPGLLQRLRKHRVPVINQMGAVECGAACLAMILSYYGRKTSVSEVRDYCGVGRDGLSALNIVKAARSYGLRVRAVSLKENDFRYVTLPAIVHWEFNHFLIVERWTPKYVDLVDPAMGRACDGRGIRQQFHRRGDHAGAGSAVQSHLSGTTHQFENVCHELCEAGSHVAGADHWSFPAAPDFRAHRPFAQSRGGGPDYPLQVERYPGAAGTGPVHPVTSATGDDAAARGGLAVPADESGYADDDRLL